MADKLTQLTLDALARAAADPAGVPLYAGKAEPGLFPAAAAARPAAQRCLDDGLLKVIRTEANGRQTRDICGVTEKGLRFLLDRGDPKVVLEDFVRAVEARRDQVDDLLAEARRLADALDGLKATVAAVLPRVGDRPLADAVLSRLAEWSAAAGAVRDCPLPDLYRALPARPSVGAFHDALRELHAAGRVYLHPWTGPLYTLPEPPLALLVGHEVAYYASLKTTDNGPPTREGFP